MEIVSTFLFLRIRELCLMNMILIINQPTEYVSYMEVYR